MIAQRHPASEREQTPPGVTDQPDQTEADRLEEIIADLKSAKRDTIYKAAVQLVEFPAEKAQPALKIIRNIQENNDGERVQVGCRYALAFFDENLEAHLDWFIEVIKRPPGGSYSNGVQRWNKIAAMWAVGSLGDKASKVDAALAIVIRSHVEWDSGHAAAALGDIGPAISNDAKQALIESLDPSISMLGKNFLIGHAAVALGKVEPDVDKALKPMIKIMKYLCKSNVWAAAQVAAALGNFGDAAAPAVDELIAQIGHQDEDLSNNSIFALGAIGPKAKKAADKIKPMLKKAAGDTLVYCHFALAGMGVDSEQHLEALSDALRVGDTVVAAARSIEKLGVRAESLKEQLQRQIKAEPNEFVQEQLEKALAAVAGEETKEGDKE